MTTNTMAAATGAASRPMIRSLSSARLMAASSSGMVVGCGAFGRSSPVRDSASTAGFSIMLLSDEVNRCHTLNSGRSSPSESLRGMGQATAGRRRHSHRDARAPGVPGGGRRR